MPTPKQNLTAARALMVGPRAFKTWAATADDRPTFPTEPDARCFCMAGAVFHTLGIHPQTLEEGAVMPREIEALADAIHPYRADDTALHFIASFNDDTKNTTEDCLAIFDRAIERA